MIKNWFQIVLGHLEFDIFRGCLSLDIAGEVKFRVNIGNSTTMFIIPVSLVEFLPQIKKFCSRAHLCRWRSGPHFHDQKRRVLKKLVPCSLCSNLTKLSGTFLSMDVKYLRSVPEIVINVTLQIKYCKKYSLILLYKTRITSGFRNVTLIKCLGIVKPK